MSDLYHYIGGDLSLSDVGDLLPVVATLQGTQRVLRRLMTNPGDYIWHPDYGAGLPQKVGQPFIEEEITALILSQMYLESVVARTPQPIVDVSAPQPGTVIVQITYNDANTAKTVVLTFDPTADLGLPIIQPPVSQGNNPALLDVNFILDQSVLS